MPRHIELASAIWVTEPVTDLHTYLGGRIRERSFWLHAASSMVCRGERLLLIHYELVPPDAFAGRPWLRTQHDCPFVGSLAGYVRWSYDADDLALEGRDVMDFARALLIEGRGVTARLADDRYFEAVRLCTADPSEGGDGSYPALQGPDGALRDPTVDFWAYDFASMDDADFWQGAEAQISSDLPAFTLTTSHAPLSDAAPLDIFTLQIDARIAGLDRRIGALLDEILHHPAFQQLERAWRGLWFVIERTSFEENIQIDLLDCSREDLLIDAEDAASLAESGFFKTVYTRAAGSGRDPYGAIITSYELGPSAQDIYLMGRCSAVAFMAQAPFIAAASPRFFGVESYRDLPSLEDLESLCDGPQYTKWQCFRETEVSRALGLTAPRFLLRAPYQRGGGERASFEYDEKVLDHEHLCWGNASFAFATRLAESFARYRWCPNIVRDGGMIEGLPQPAGRAAPTEVQLSEKAGSLLAEAGLIPLLGMSGGRACFGFAPSAQKPRAFGATDEGRDAEFDFRLGTQLPYFFILCRLIHYLEIVYHTCDYAQAARADVERELNAWIARFVADAGVLDAAARARRPLRMVRITITDTEDAHEPRKMELRVRPHFKRMGRFFMLSITKALEKK